MTFSFLSSFKSAKRAQASYRRICGQTCRPTFSGSLPARVLFREITGLIFFIPAWMAAVMVISTAL